MVRLWRHRPQAPRQGLCLIPCPIQGRPPHRRLRNRRLLSRSLLNRIRGRRPNPICHTFSPDLRTLVSSSRIHRRNLTKAQTKEARRCVTSRPDARRSPTPPRSPINRHRLPATRSGASLIHPSRQPHLIRDPTHLTLRNPSRLTNPSRHTGRHKPIIRERRSVRLRTGAAFVGRQGSVQARLARRHRSRSARVPDRVSQRFTISRTMSAFRRSS